MKRAYRENKRKMPRYGFAILGHRSHAKVKRLLKEKRFKRWLETDERRLRKKYLG